MPILVAPTQFGSPKVIDATVSADHSVSASAPGFGPNVQPRALVIKTISAEAVSSDCVISFGFNGSFDDVVKSYVIRPKPEAIEVIVVDMPIYQFQDVSAPFDGVSSASLRIVTPASATSFTFTYAFVYDQSFDIMNEEVVDDLFN